MAKDISATIKIVTTVSRLVLTLTEKRDLPRLGLLLSLLKVETFVLIVSAYI